MNCLGKLLLRDSGKHAQCVVNCYSGTVASTLSVQKTVTLGQWQAHSENCYSVTVARTLGVRKIVTPGQWQAHPVCRKLTP